MGSSISCRRLLENYWSHCYKDFKLGNHNIGFEQQTNCQESYIFQKKKELFFILYVLANNPHNVQDAFIYYERQTAGENLNIL